MKVLTHLCYILIFLLVFSANASYGANIDVNAPTAYAAPDGLCSLVEAIENSNNDASVHADCTAGLGPDVITLLVDVELDGTAIFDHNGPNGLPSITSEIFIEANNRTISRSDTAPEFRIFHVADTGILTLNRATISGGIMNLGFEDGGGIYNEGTLNVLESTVSQNKVMSIFPSGGGIYNIGTLTIINSLLTHNDAVDDTFSNGGGIYNALDNTVTIINSQIENNTANDGGGLWTAGETTIQNSVFKENTARENGGAIIMFGGTPAPIYEVNNTTFDNNMASEGGGAILNGNDNTKIFRSFFLNNTLTDSGTGGAIGNIGGIISITASLFEGNQALGTAVGGAISNTLLGEIHLTGSYVSNNMCATNGGGLYTSLANFFITDSVIEGNQANTGGGFYHAPSNVDGFFIERSTILNNTADSLGGGGAAEGNQSTSYITNSTLTGNTAPNFGGALGLNAGGQIDLLHTAIADNMSVDFTNSVGGFNAFAGTTNIGSTIIANNLNRDCSATSSSASLDYNITTGPAGGIPPDRWCSFIPLQPNDLTDTDPLFEPLAQNGNLGPTYLLKPLSPAANAIPADCPAELDGVDQRGVARPAGSCDIGPVSDEIAILPEIYFNLPSSIIDNEATLGGVHQVDIVVDNILGTVTSPAMELTLYIGVQGTAALDTDYNTSIDIPSMITINPGNWPMPGTSSVLQIDISTIDDLLIEGTETIEFSISHTGPGVLGAQTTHTVSILDDEDPFTLFPLFPAVSSNINTVSVENASTGGRVAIIWGYEPGSVILGGSTCNGIELGIKKPKLLKILTADSEGSAQYDLFIPLIGDFEFSILMQALDIDSCALSEVIENIIRSL